MVINAYFCLVKSLLKAIILWVCLNIPQGVKGQGDYNRYWYFGNQAGLDFATNPPTVLTNGAMSAFEGCATISDPAGVLQFYTNGKNVWNRNHTVMPTGSGLNGDGAATQTAIIVPAPGIPTSYYIFTVDTNGGPRGLNYSIVDMTLNGGLGDVTVKNIQLQTPVTEKLTAVRHANGIDAWVIVHDWNGGNYSSYLLTATGINPAPVVSSIGTIHGGNFTNSHGYLKASPNARKMAAAIRGSSVVELFDFSNITGQLTNPVSLIFSSQTYGVEYSSDNHFLYAGLTSNPGLIYQYDITLPIASIAGSQTLVGTHPGLIGALQLGRDGKIYVCQFQSPSLAMISSPTLQGAACAFSSNALFLGGQTGQYGLPNFLQSFFIVADFTYTDTCSGYPTNFSTVLAGGADSVKWNFGDPGSGVNNFSTVINPQHTYVAAGSYTVELIAYQTLLTDTVRYTIQIFETPNPDLGIDRLSCTIPEVLDGGFYPNFPPATYLWSNGSTTQTFDVFADGLYWVEVTRLGCMGRDSVSITVTSPPVVDLGPDQTVCEGQVVILDAENPGAVYEWYDGSVDRQDTITQPGTYWVTVTVGTCVEMDTVIIDFSPSPVADLGTDTTICTGSQLFLFPFGSIINGTTYLWQDGSTTQGIIVNEGGTYSVQMKVGTCVDQDTIFIDEQTNPEVDLGEDQFLCLGQQYPLDVTTYGAHYLWQDGSSEPTYSPMITGNYYVDVTNLCGTDADSIYMNFQECNCNVYVPNAFTPNGDPTNAIFRLRHACVEFSSKMSIFNRFGQRLFVSEDDQLGWDGTFDGKEAKEDVYVYEIKYRTFDSGQYVEVTLRDTFLLLR